MAFRKIPPLPKIIVCAVLLTSVFIAIGQLQDVRKAHNWNTLDTRAAQNMLAQPLKETSSIAYLKAYANTALAQSPSDYKRAKVALLRLAELTPADPSVWNMLAFVDTNANGFFTRDSVIALRKSYETAPYGGFNMMMWRVDFASEHWSALSDDLQAKTLTQIPVIAKFGPSWDWREAHCWDNPHKAIYQPICATTPGIPRKGQPIESLK